MESNIYAKVKEYIEQTYDALQSWEDVRELRNFSFPIEMTLQFIAQQQGVPQDYLSKNKWDQLVDEVKKSNEAIEVTKMGPEIINDARISHEKGSAWNLYQEKLRSQGWTEDSIQNVKKSSFEILKNLSMDTQKDGPVKGLVIGNVQSGKTANMAGLMAMAADNGFNYFIVLSGVIENLRRQTSTRLYNDMTQSGKGNLHWHLIEKPSLRDTTPTKNISNFNLGVNDKDRYLTVCLKNKMRLESLVDWLYSDKNKAQQLKILVIDDESDQASVNTNVIEEEEETTINRLIKKLVNNDVVQGMNYISYTATPYANILNEVSSDSLYPKDFIILLTPSSDYIGPREIFGMEMPDTQPFIDIIRNIPNDDVEAMKRIHEGKVDKLPKSLKKSIHWFLLTVAVMRSWEHRKPITMLVHTSFKIEHHKHVAEAIGEYLVYFKQNYEHILPSLEKLYLDESIEFSRSYFIEGLVDYSNPEEVRDYPSWSEVKKYLDYFVRLDSNEYLSHIPIGEQGQPTYHKGIHMVIDNSGVKADDQIVRLVYPKSDSSVAPAFIVIGGNTLARGLTLEGLTTTFFLRTTNQADTLMQMGRWFGYRKGYEILPRVWLEYMALERYRFLAQMNEELRGEIERYSKNGLTPIDYAPRVKNSYNHQLIRITSKNKMQVAKAVEFDFSGLNTQTVYFDNDEKRLKKNLTVTKEFLNKLPNMSIKENKIIWRNVDSEYVKTYLSEYRSSDSDIKMKNLPALIQWIEENSDKLEKWNIILSGTGQVEEVHDEDYDWNIQGYTLGKSMRTKLRYRSNDSIACIGSLRAPADLLADIDAELSIEEKQVAKSHEVQRIREKYGYDTVPQLIIYRIDKGQESEEEYQLKHMDEHGNYIRSNRSPLNFPVDLIGINLMIPGKTKGGNSATYISAKINTVETQIMEE